MRLGLIIAVMLLGCATKRYKTEITYFGDVDLDKNRLTAERAKELPWRPEPDYNVRVVQGKLPEGLSISENGSKIVVSSSHEKEFEVLGLVKSSRDMDFVRDYFWYAPLHEKHAGFRTDYCKAQAPLKAITLGLWFFVPLYYPCFPTYPSDENMGNHVQELKRAAYLMGANLLVLAQVSDRESTTTSLVYVGNTPWLSSSTSKEEGVELTGFAIKQKIK